MKFGIDRLITDPTLRAPLKGRRVALLAHPASVTPDLTHSLDALAACGDLKITAAFGPQHGLRGDKQDNVIGSPDFHAGELAVDATGWPVPAQGLLNQHHPRRLVLNPHSQVAMPRLVLSRHGFKVL